MSSAGRWELATDFEKPKPPDESSHSSSKSKQPKRFVFMLRLD